MSTHQVSVVVPIYNEVESLPELHEILVASLEKVGPHWEILYVDDGSTDGSFEVLRGFHQGDPRRVRVIRFRRNFGQTAALAAGFHQARGEVVVTLDADLQNDPRDIPLLLERLQEGYDVVSGWRVHRKDPWWSRRLPSRLANALISWMTGVYLHDYGCTLKAYRREVVKHLQLYGEMHRFIPALASWMGVRVAEVPVRHHPRRYGRSKYGISRTIRVLLDLIVVKFLLAWVGRPIHIFGGMGLLSCALGVGVEGVALGMKVLQGVDLTGNPLLYLGILLLLIGVQFISLGLLGEMLLRTYHESQGRPIYVIREILEAPSQQTQQNPSSGS